MFRKLPIFIALLALVSSLGGNLATYKTNQNAINKINSESAVRRVVIAKTDLDLCTKIFGEIDLIEKQALKQENFSLYKKLLPSLSNSEINNLVTNARSNTQKAIIQFDPALCQKLPSQKLTN